MTTTPAKKNAAVRNTPAPSTKTPRTAVKRAADQPAAAPTKPVKNQTVASVAAKTEKKKDKAEKVKVVRDSFTIPKTEYAQIAAMKKRAMELGLEVKKSELIRAGLLLLAATSEAAFRKALSQVPTLKTGRPGKA